MLPPKNQSLQGLDKPRSHVRLGKDMPHRTYLHLGTNRGLQCPAQDLQSKAYLPATYPLCLRTTLSKPRWSMIFWDPN